MISTYLQGPDAQPYPRQSQRRLRNMRPITILRGAHTGWAGVKSADQRHPQVELTRWAQAVCGTADDDDGKSRIRDFLHHNQLSQLTIKIYRYDPRAAAGSQVTWVFLMSC